MARLLKVLRIAEICTGIPPLITQIRATLNGLQVLFWSDGYGLEFNNWPRSSCTWRNADLYNENLRAEGICSAFSSVGDLHSCLLQIYKCVVFSGY